MKKAKFKLTDYKTGEVMDTGIMLYDEGVFGPIDHNGLGAIHDVLRNSYLDEYLGAMLVEHINCIDIESEGVIYIHEPQFPVPNDYPYDYTPAFCFDDETPEPFMVFTVTQITVIPDDND